MTEAVKELTKKNEQVKEEAPVFSTSVDIIEKAGGFVLLADLPGVDGKTLDITVEKDMLEIKGSPLSGDEGLNPVHREYGTGVYRRVFRLTDEVDRNGIRATITNGVLRVELPKAKEAAPRKITITAN